MKYRVKITEVITEVRYLTVDAENAEDAARQASAKWLLEAATDAPPEIDVTERTYETAGQTFGTEIEGGEEDER